MTQDTGHFNLICCWFRSSTTLYSDGWRTSTSLNLMVAGPVSIPIFWWLQDQYFPIFRWLQDQNTTIFWWLKDQYNLIFWWLQNQYFLIFWRLQDPDSFIVWWLQDLYNTIFWWLQDQYNLTWTVDSFLKIDEYRILYRILLVSVAI